MNNQAKRNILPENPTQAARELIKLSQTLVELADRETQALVQGDLLTFNILQDEKELLATRYARSSEEFRERLEEFRTLDRNLLDQMENIQKQLGEKNHSNNTIVARMYQRSEQKTQATLFTAQELAQQKPVRLAASQEERV